MFEYFIGSNVHAVDDQNRIQVQLKSSIRSCALMVYLFDIMTKQFCMFVYYDATFKYNIPDKILLGKVKYGFMVDSIVLNIFHINKV